MGRADQAAGHARPDIDPAAIGRGPVAVFVSQPVAAAQFGTERVDLHGADVMPVLEAAVAPVGWPTMDG